MPEIHSPHDRRRLRRVLKEITPLTPELPINRSDLVYYGKGWEEEPERKFADTKGRENIIVELPKITPSRLAKPPPRVM